MDHSWDSFLDEWTDSTAPPESQWWSEAEEEEEDASWTDEDCGWLEVNSTSVLSGVPDIAREAAPSQVEPTAAQALGRAGPRGAQAPQPPVDAWAEPCDDLEPGTAGDLCCSAEARCNGLEAGVEEPQTVHGLELGTAEPPVIDLFSDPPSDEDLDELAPRLTYGSPGFLVAEARRRRRARRAAFPGRPQHRGPADDDSDTEDEIRLF